MKEAMLTSQTFHSEVVSLPHLDQQRVVFTDVYCQITHIWCTKWTKGTILYLSNRYLVALEAPIWIACEYFRSLR